ncbi:uncharacterized protein LOC109518728 [Hippocampus comes]|uniref:uncharacterized protein LOC109518728 n=1 Tax=Hippocampus comes TaxID=109280 RepID=UPI00094EEB6E|nr:PREDICTED: uncharacterized protein LOC109518728 [Hippocampus comes]XP_019730313.1 PREDICTED: uncharacterized protein LOC109518728 [Hippocampus comes]
MDSAAPTTTTTEITSGQRKNWDEAKVLMSSKPLHRFVQKEPQSLGVVIVICGCVEFMMGFILISEPLENSTKILIPFWQGALLLVCGSLSIYTGAHPSKRMVTVCLAMYVVAILGIIVSVGYRVVCISSYRFLRYYAGPRVGQEWNYSRMLQLYGIEGILCTCSLCVSVLLIFLSAVARLALKSTHTQVIFQQISTPQDVTTAQE